MAPPKKSCKCPPEKKLPQNTLAKLKMVSIISADSGDMEEIKKYKTYATEVTTNPSLLVKEVAKEEFKEILDKAVAYGKENGEDKEQKVKAAIDMLFVAVASELQKIVSGTVSIEVDPRLSFEKDKTVTQVKKLVEICDKESVDKSRILIKIAATWEGIQAAKDLQAEGIRCNLTLIFSLAQAVACAEANVEAVSPFCGRVRDYAEKQGTLGDVDPGVTLVTEIYNYLKKFNYCTKVLGASFRNCDEIKALAGCDMLTISPKLMDELKGGEEDVPRQLSEEKAQEADIQKLDVTEGTFRWLINDDEMACEKLSEGIRKFAQDIKKLEEVIGPLMDE